MGTESGTLASGGKTFSPRPCVQMAAEDGRPTAPFGCGLALGSSQVPRLKSQGHSPPSPGGQLKMGTLCLRLLCTLCVWPCAGKSHWSPKRKRSVNSRRLWPAWQRASAASPWAAAPKIKVIAQDLLASWQLRMGLEILVAQALLAGIYSCQERVLRPRKQHVSMAQGLMNTPGSSLKDFLKLKTFWSTPEMSTCLFMTMSPQILRLTVCHNCLSAPHLFFHASHCQRCCCQIPVPKETGVPAPSLSASQHCLLALRG